MKMRDPSLILNQLLDRYDQASHPSDILTLFMQNMDKHKEEKKKTNIEVLEDIEREEGEDRPNIAGDEPDLINQLLTLNTHDSFAGLGQVNQEPEQDSDIRGEEEEERRGSQAVC